MKKTLIAVVCATFISTGAMAKPASHNNDPKPSNSHTVHMVDHGPKKPAPHHAHNDHHHRPAPAPVTVAHHHHNDSGAILLGDFILAFAILASNAM
jgi:hypothetical protein